MIHCKPVIGSLLSGAEAEAATKDLMSRFALAGALQKEGDTETAALRVVEVVFKRDDGAAEAQPLEWQEMWRLNGRTLPVQFAAPPGHQITCEELSGLQTPTLVIEGSKTHARYSLMAEALVACLPNATLQTFEGYVHDGPYSAAGEVAERLITFAKR